MADDRLDGVYLNLAQQAGSIEPLLDSFFGFLLRKTDFYTGIADEKEAEKMVMKYFSKYSKQGKKKREDEAEKNRLADEERKTRAAEKRKKEEEEFQRRQEEMKSQPKIEEVVEDEEPKIEEVVDEPMPAAEEAEKPAEEKKEEEEEDNTPPPPGNGGSTDTYTWTQTLGAVEVSIPIRPGTKSKQCVVDMGVTKCKVGLKGEPPIIDGLWKDKIRPDECMWNLVDNKMIVLTLEKHDQMKWWSCCIQGDPEIDTKKIVPENSKLSDLDGETRQTVEKMMFDQRQKAAGKPTSDQMKQHDLLEKFKQAHPEMDFSKANVNYGGSSSGGNFNFG